MTTSSTAERLACLALAVLLATALTACGGGDQGDDNGTFEPALAPSQTRIRK
jgi:hypothetical protein